MRYLDRQEIISWRSVCRGNCASYSKFTNSRLDVFTKFIFFGPGDTRNLCCRRLQKPFIAFLLDQSEFPDEVLYFVTGYPRLPLKSIHPASIRSTISALVPS